MIDLNYASSDNPSTVLLIGNTFGILKRIAYALQHNGHAVIWGDSGSAGLAMFECENPALVVSEIDLTDISGIEVCQTIKSSFFGDTPVVLVGKLCDEGSDSRMAIKAGADDYLVSFSEAQLVLGKLEWLMKRYRSPWDGCQMIHFTETPEETFSSGAAI